MLYDDSLEQRALRCVALCADLLVAGAVIFDAVYDETCNCAGDGKADQCVKNGPPILRENADDGSSVEIGKVR